MKHDRIVLAHGGGGTLTRDLVEKIIVPAVGGDSSRLPDAARIPGTEDLVFTTDSFVVKPLFFSGGDIGSLSVHGTVNDLAVSGAEPLAISLSLVIEEGLEIETLQRIVASAGRAAKESGVSIVTGDTKVVARGEADEIFITTAGVGIRRIDLDDRTVRPGDRVLLSGSIAEHGIAVMSRREGIQFETQVKSDSAPVWPFVRALIDGGIDVRVMRDPTRGGLAAALVELSDDFDVTTALVETDIPLNPEVAAAAEMLGLDPLTVANEGKLVAYIAETDASRAIEIIRSIPGGAAAAIIGTVEKRRAVSVYAKTAYGGDRVIDMPYGEDLPRIC
ncbi:MAG: hydrogenase expression/formation protein HypE [Deltaproteobacteria bacterium]|nr:hydrogenase expression/formation protein HypE [Candidatus Zymogenaceae bacterium]